MKAKLNKFFIGMLLVSTSLASIAQGSWSPDGAGGAIGMGNNSGGGFQRDGAGGLRGLRGGQQVSEGSGCPQAHADAEGNRNLQRMVFRLPYQQTLQRNGGGV